MEIPLILATFEMLIINMISFNYCCPKKYSGSITWTILAAFSILFLPCVFLLSPYFGDGRMLVLGFLYLVPFYFLYKEKLSRLFLIMCMCWVYTISIYTLAFQFSSLMAKENQDMYTFLLQTALFAVTLYPFFKWVVPKYMFILQNIEKFGTGCAKYFNFNCFLHFVTILILNIAFYQETGSILKILSILLFSSITLLSYTMLYRMVSDSIQIRHLERVSQHDSLTGLANHDRLYHDLQTLLQGKQVFSILFVDLDRFKEINDCYGHIVGDQYLRHFATICAKIFQENGKTYRFGGDEFVVLYQGIIPPKAIEQLQQCREWEEGAPCPFNQVSTGSIVCRPPFPDAEELLHQVDRKMYEMKLKARESD